MSDPDVRELFLRAVTDNDSAAMHEGIERLFGLTGDGLSPEAEFRSPRGLPDGDAAVGRANPWT
jgi:hypothetical protein